MKEREGNEKVKRDDQTAFKFVRKKREKENCECKMKERKEIRKR